jgi:hypothetical protein
MAKCRAVAALEDDLKKWVRRILAGGASVDRRFDEP